MTVRTNFYPCIPGLVTLGHLDEPLLLLGGHLLPPVPAQVGELVDVHLLVRVLLHYVLVADVYEEGEGSALTTWLLQSFCHDACDWL